MLHGVQTKLADTTYFSCYYFFIFEFLFIRSDTKKQLKILETLRRNRTQPQNQHYLKIHAFPIFQFLSDCETFHHPLKPLILTWCFSPHQLFHTQKITLSLSKIAQIIGHQTKVLLLNWTTLTLRRCFKGK